jgi:hypothetical protein
MYYYRYRKNGGKVEGISLDDIWTDSTYIGVFSTDIEYPLEPPLWCDGSTIRTATVQEISDFLVKEQEDLSLQHRSSAKDVVDGVSDYKSSLPRVVRALVSLMLQEINVLRTQASFPEYTWEQMKTALKNKIDEES